MEKLAAQTTQNFPVGNENTSIGSISIVCRENDLFKKYLPPLVKHIESMNGDVAIQFLPAGIPKDEISDWYKKTYDINTGRRILNERRLYSMIMNVFIESLCCQFGSNKTLSGFEQLFTNLFQHILANGFSPKKIIILTEDIRNYMENYVVTINSWSKIENEVYAAELFKDLIKQAGYDSKNIMIMNQLTPELDVPENAVLVDRRNGIYESRWEKLDPNSEELNLIPNKARKFGLPFPDFVGDVNRYGFLNLDEEVILEKLRLEFAEYYKK